jgi:Sin3 histone deacetylase corepressor complex component SDS3
MSEEEFEEEISNDCPEYEECISDEDTEDASETDMLKYEGEYTEIKEQMYQDKLGTLKEQLRLLENDTHPEYTKRVVRVKQVYDERLFLNEAFLDFETERAESEFIQEKKAALREFDERKSDLKESLMQELEEKKKHIEAERTSIDLMTEGVDPRPITTRKLRRRPNEPVPIPEKRKRGPPATLNQLLEDSEINEDVKLINKSLSKYNR